MEGSLVKMRISEREKKLSDVLDSKQHKPLNGTMQKDGKYYLVRLEMEREKLKSLSEEAERCARLSQVSEEALGKIRNAVGKAHLLTTKRFKQFSELCHDNIVPDPEKRETKPSDLQGYWEMMNIQIEDVEELFGDIKKWRENDWKIPETTDSSDGPRKSSSKNGLHANSKSKNRSQSKSPKGRGSGVDDEKAKREARSRLAAARKQAKLRLKEQQATENSFEIPSGDLSVPVVQLNGLSSHEASPISSSVEDLVDKMVNTPTGLSDVEGQSALTNGGATVVF